jgi:hypothetical protein
VFPPERAGPTGLLAPGGVLVLGDAVDLTPAVAAGTPYTRTMRAMWQSLKDTIGTGDGPSGT